MLLDGVDMELPPVAVVVDVVEAGANVAFRDFFLVGESTTIPVDDAAAAASDAVVVVGGNDEDL
jgi:hypothetical protein